MLEDPFRQPGASGRVQTRQSVLLRLVSHDAYHFGHLSQTLGIHDVPQIDLSA